MIPGRFDEEELSRIAARLSAIRPRRLKTAPRDAAVLVTLCTQDGEPSVLFTKRSERVGTHKGQVSFPGGMVDDTDDGATFTALRELEEEIGFPRERVRVLGQFHEMQAITGVRVIPVVGFLGEIDPGRLEPNEAEIDHVFALPFRDLVDPEKRYDQILGDRGPHPVFDAGPYPVWGLTAAILKEVLLEVFDIELGPGRA